MSVNLNPVAAMPASEAANQLATAGAANQTARASRCSPCCDRVKAAALAVLFGVLVGVAVGSSAFAIGASFGVSIIAAGGAAGLAYVALAVILKCCAKRNVQPRPQSQAQPHATVRGPDPRPADAPAASAPAAVPNHGPAPAPAPVAPTIPAAAVQPAEPRKFTLPPRQSTQKEQDAQPQRSAAFESAHAYDVAQEPVDHTPLMAEINREKALIVLRDNPLINKDHSKLRSDLESANNNIHKLLSDERRKLLNITANSMTASTLLKLQQLEAIHVDRKLKNEAIEIRKHVNNVLTAQGKERLPEDPFKSNLEILIEEYDKLSAKLLANINELETFEMLELLIPTLNEELEKAEKPQVEANNEEIIKKNAKARALSIQTYEQEVQVLKDEYDVINQKYEAASAKYRQMNNSTSEANRTLSTECAKLGTGLAEKIAKLAAKEAELKELKLNISSAKPQVSVA